jgi:hypothetical protein
MEDLVTHACFSFSHPSLPSVHPVCYNLDHLHLLIHRPAQVNPWTIRAKSTYPRETRSNQEHPQYVAEGRGAE